MDSNAVCGAAGGGDHAFKHRLFTNEWPTHLNRLTGPSSFSNRKKYVEKNEWVENEWWEAKEKINIAHHHMRLWEEEDFK